MADEENNEQQQEETQETPEEVEAPAGEAESEDVGGEAADDASSRILDQVSAGVAIRMSVLYHLLAGEESA